MVAPFSASNIVLFTSHLFFNVMGLEPVKELQEQLSIETSFQNLLSSKKINNYIYAISFLLFTIRGLTQSFSHFALRIIQL